MKKFSNLTEKIPEIFLFTLSGAWLLGGLYLIAIALITNPTQQIQVRYFHTVQECLNAQINSLRCQKAYNLAKNEHLNNYWEFDSKEVCEEKAPTISTECEAIKLGNKTFYKPILLGFLMTTESITYKLNERTYTLLATPVYGSDFGKYSNWLQNGETIKISGNSKYMSVQELVNLQKFKEFEDDE